MDATSENMEGLLKNVDVIIDATDNFDIRFVINDLSQNIIFRGYMVLALIIWYELYNYSARDTVFTLYAEKYPCYRCDV